MSNLSSPLSSPFLVPDESKFAIAYDCEWELTNQFSFSACCSSFSSPNDFVSTAGTFETVGASAYAGAMQELSIAQHVTDAASILATEFVEQSCLTPTRCSLFHRARQAAYLQGQVEGFNAWNTPYETPLTMNQAWTLVSAFISSCPANNPVIFTTAFPTLVAQTNYTAGQNISIAFQSNATGQSNSTSSSYSDSTSYTSLDLSTSVGLSSSTSNSTNFTGGSGYYLAILTGLGKLYAPISYVAGDVWTAVLPEALATRGVAYGLVTNSNSSTADNATVAGMLVLKFPYNSTVAQGL